MSHPIPAAALDKHIAVLGMTGSGKTSVIKAAIVEPDFEEDRRVIIITPKDDWWGLRLSKTGKSKGYDIPIFGGYHEDYPLRVADAELLAETYGTMKGSAIFCTAKLSTQDRARWFSAFAETLLRKNKGWVRVVIDEAHVYMPKQGGKGGGAIPFALHAGNELVSQGRSQGLRIVLASQRSAKLHNDGLTQCSCLIAMMLMAPHDRDAVKDWIEDQADPQAGKEIISSLAQLKPGEAWVWAPRAGMLDRIQFPRPKTYDSSAAPDEDSEDAPKLAPVSLDALQGKLAKVEAERKANDPSALRAEISRLQRELSSKKPDVDADEISTANFNGFRRGKIVGYADAVQGVLGEYAALVRALDAVERQFRELRESAARIETWAKRKPASVELVPSPAPTVPPRMPPRARPSSPSSEQLDRPLQVIVDSIRWWNVLGVRAPSHSQVAFVAGYSHKSGTWATYLSRLRSSGLIEGRGDLILTQEGANAARDPDIPPTGDHLRQVVFDKLDAPLVRILQPIIEAYPRGLSHVEAADTAGYSSSSGTWATYLSRLRSLDLIEGRGALKAQDWLFPVKMAAE